MLPLIKGMGIMENVAWLRSYRCPDSHLGFIDRFLSCKEKHLEKMRIHLELFDAWCHVRQLGILDIGECQILDFEEYLTGKRLVKAREVGIAVQVAKEFVVFARGVIQ